jgi:hypothetical protein
MVIKSRIGKVAGVALAAGVLAVAGLGLGTASADNGGTPGGATPGAQQMRPDNRPGPRPGQNGPAQSGPGQLQRGTGQLQGIPGGPHGMQQAEPRPGRAAPNAANNQEAVRARGVIAAAAEVLAVQPESVLAGLEQGQTLTAVAASHGLSRDYFLSELVAQVEKDIKDGQRFGIPASANLNVQLTSIIDDAGLGLRGVALTNLF